MSVTYNSELSAVAEARLLHSAQPGYFCLARATPAADGSRGGWSQSFYPTPALESAALAARNQADVYISQASFFSRQRAVANTKMLRCAWVDLDVYKLGLQADDATVMSILRVAGDAGLPVPTYITKSGRGLYAKWVFSDPISSDLLPQWQTLQDLLIALYRSLGADPGVKDAARVLRLAQTVNSKSDRLVEIVCNSGTLHSFRDLCAAAARIDVPLAVGEARQQARAAAHRIRTGLLSEAPTDLGALSNYSLTREPILMRRGSLQTLNWYRFLDLRDLTLARGGIHKGARDLTLFWMTSFLALANVITPANLWDELRGLLLAFPIGKDFDPLRDGSLATLIKRIQAHDRGERIKYRGGEYTPIYTPNNETLLNMLEVSPEEERSLRTIISGQEKQRRADIKCPGRAERRVQRDEERRVAATLHAGGKSIKEIADNVGRSFSTVWRWLQPDPMEGQPVLERRGRRASQHASLCHAGGPGSPIHQPCSPRPVPAAFTPAEISRRTKVRRGRPHLQPGRRWGADDLAAWLARRKEHQERVRQLAEQARAQEQEVREAARAQAALATQILLTSLRERALARSQAGSISISIGCSLSSRKTGPPSGAT